MCQKWFLPLHNSFNSKRKTRHAGIYIAVGFFDPNILYFICQDFSARNFVASRYLEVSRIYAVNSFFGVCAAKRDSWSGAGGNHGRIDSKWDATRLFVHGPCDLKVSCTENTNLWIIMSPATCPAPRQRQSAPLLFASVMRAVLAASLFQLTFCTGKHKSSGEPTRPLTYAYTENVKALERFLFLGKISATPHPQLSECSCMSCYWRSIKVLRAIEWARTTSLHQHLAIDKCINP